MEKESFENKMMKDLRDNLEDINRNLKAATSTIDEKLKKELGAKGFARWKAYNTKYFKLIQEGKELEAKELEKTFLSGE